MLKSVAFMGIAATLAQAAIPAERQAQFTSYIQKHSKQYSATEFFTKFATFSANMDHIEEHNSSNSKWTMAMNEFGDMTADEFKATYLGYKQVRSDFMRSLNTAEFDATEEFADALDWRSKGAVTPVKDQGECGSCWAFSTTGSIEGATQLSTGTLPDLAEQELVDCAGKEGNEGCNGGLMDYAFEYVISNKGLCAEGSYPYKAADGTCNKSCGSKAGAITGYKDVAQGSEKALMAAVNKTPVSIAIQADQSGFQFYSGGVMDATCGDQLDHGVLLAGYGTDGGKDYWLVKNSWGASWGEKGYIRLVRGKNQCGIADSASYPTF